MFFHAIILLYSEFRHRNRGIVAIFTSRPIWWAGNLALRSAPALLFALKTLTREALVICSIVITLENSNAANRDDTLEARFTLAPIQAGTRNSNLFKVLLSRAGICLLRRTFKHTRESKSKVEK
jgi:hypothetical protein